MTEITAQNTMGDLKNIPELEKMSKYIIYTGNGTDDAERLAGFQIASAQKIGWSPEGIVRGINFLIRQSASGVRPYFVYPEKDWEEDPQKRDVNVVRLIPEEIDSRKPYLILAAGGAYESVCSGVEAYPTAVHLVKRGYQVFVLTYRIGGKAVLPKALEDLAAALSFIRSRASEFELDPDNYVLNGFSAGGNLLSVWGISRIGYAAYGIPKPRAMFLVYPLIDLSAWARMSEGRALLDIMLGEGWTKEQLERYDVSRHIKADYPPCYIVCGRDDTAVPCANSERLKEELDRFDIPVMLEEEESAPHGFGDGTGTGAEDWPDRAIGFLESLKNVDRSGRALTGLHEKVEGMK